MKDRARGQELLEVLERFLCFFSPFKLVVFASEISQRFDNDAEVRDELAVKVGQTDKTSDSCHRCGSWEFSDGSGLGFSWTQESKAHFVSQELDFGHHE